MNYILVNTLLIIGVVIAVAAAIVLILRRFSKHNGGKIVTVIFTCLLFAGILTALIPFSITIQTSRTEGTLETFDSSLESAASEGDLERVKLLLEKGADPDAIYDTTDGFGYTPLTHACIGGYYDIAKLLIENGADVNAVDTNNETPLMYAAMGSEEITKLLIEKGADIKAQDYDGYTALHKAASVGNLATVKLLVENGADVNAEAKTYITPIQSACMIRDEASAELLKYLIKKGADTSVEDSSGRDLIELLEYTKERILENLDKDEFNEDDITYSYKKAKEVLDEHINGMVIVYK